MLVHLLPHIGMGGDVVVVKAMVRALAGKGEPIVVNGLSPADAFGGRVPNPLPLNEGTAGFRKAWSRRDVIPRDARIIHAHSPICLAFALMLRRLHCRNARIILTFHWPGPDASDLRRRVKGSLLRTADLIHVISVDSGEIVRGRYGVPRERVKLLHIGVPEDRFAVSDPVHVRRALLARLGIRGTTRIVGYLGRLATEKNVDYLIRFMAEHAPLRPDLHLIVAGGGDLEAALRAQAMSCPAADRIHFTGYTREPESIYPAFDLLVLPSDFEAFGLVVVEAAYCGVPSLRSDVDGSHDQILEATTGFIYPQKLGYEGMSRALLRTLDESWDRLPEMGRAARTHCLQLCDMRRFSEGLEALYSTPRA